MEVNLSLDPVGIKDGSSDLCRLTLDPQLTAIVSVVLKDTDYLLYINQTKEERTAD